ncbi:MAG: hypothetical protein ABSB50_18945 [Terracidiphilus sp.]|jgi:hypothetical protein
MRNGAEIIRREEEKARILIYEAIMREEGEIICKPGEEISASVFSGLG